MKIKVNPTRMELLKLKRRVQVAKRGHKLLKDKEEQLLIEFRKLLDEIKDKRKKVEEELYQYYLKVVELKGITQKKKWENLIASPFIKTEVKVIKKRIFNIPVKEINFEVKETLTDYFSSPYYQFLIEKGTEVINRLFYLYHLENKLISFTEEIERTRRRVNALEYVLIPGIEEAIKFIKFKLEENERANLTKLKHLQLIELRHTKST
ncbi:MAG TPA: V-type ATP synthase subunit D [Candidatus Ratteibacteria bacterium]|nr:V-type ATP synthase subunit D [Candidatus Ratteibacteria bacterium]